MNVSIIVPFRNLNDYVRTCIRKCQELDYDNYQIVLLPDEELKEKFDKCIVIPTGPVHPMVKRNIAIKQLDSPIMASIDSDAYPQKDWLKEAVPLLENDNVFGVGGPNLPPHKADLMERAAIDIVYSRLGLSGAYKIKGAGVEEHREMASSNLIYKRDIMLKVGCYDIVMQTGADSVLGFMVRNIGKKILYSPKVVVYHHRRGLFWKHLTRIYQQASDKAVIVMRMFSADRIIYFVPSAFVIYLILALLLWFYIGNILVFIPLAFYALMVLIEAIRLRSIVRGYLFLIGTPLTHIAYGLGFIKGLFISVFSNPYKDVI